MEEKRKVLQNKAQASKRTAWHPAFVSGLRITLYDYRDDLTYEVERPLTQEPQYIDVLVVKKNRQIRINRTVAEHFREKTVVEYKGCGDALDLRTIHKTVGYTSMYYALQTKDDPVDPEELTACIFRYAFPGKLLRQLTDRGVKVEKKHEGVYLVENTLCGYPVLIVIIKELPHTAEYAALHMLTKKPGEEDIRMFLLETGRHMQDRDYKAFAHSVINVAYPGNVEIFKKVTREDEMKTGTIMDLVEDKIQEREKAVEEKVKSELQSELQKKDGELKAKDGELKAKDGELKAKDGELKAKDGELQKKDTEINSLKAQIQSMMEEMKKFKTAML